LESHLDGFEKSYQKQSKTVVADAGYGRLKKLKQKNRKRLLSEKGLEYRRPIVVEAVFGQLKSNNKFNRFTLKGLQSRN
jgi:hypothetical protein